MIPTRPAEAERSRASSVLTAGFPAARYEERTITTPDGTDLFGALLRQPGSELTILYFGGNGYTVERFGAGTARAILPHGVDLFLVDHRGYGWSGGEPSAERLLADALAVYDHLARVPGASPIVVHGQSLGSFLAAHVAANRSTAGVVLESSATTPREWATVQVPALYRPFVRIEVAGPLASISNLAAVERIEEPLLLITGSADATTPVRLARKLYETSPLPPGRKTLVVLGGAGHNDVMRHSGFDEAYRSFLERVTGGGARRDRSGDGE